MTSFAEEKIIEDELVKKSPDWGKINKAVVDLRDNINHLYEDNETILSSLYYYGENGGERLLKLTKLFLMNGFDVKANDGINGASCLKQLCWSSYDQYILLISEELLQAGADPTVKLEEDDENGLLDSIGWKLAYWNTGYCDAANLFEAYYTQIERFIDKKAYIGIRAFDECIGKKISKIEKISFSSSDENDIKDCFSGALVIWSDDTPLVISDYLDMMVNPYVMDEAVTRQDVSSELPELIGKTIHWMHFTHYGMAELSFTDGKRLIFFSDSVVLQESKNRCVHYVLENRERTKDVVLPGSTIECIYLCQGTLHSETSREYDEDALMLDYGNTVIHLSSKKLQQDCSEIVAHRLPRTWINDQARHILGGPYRVSEIKTHKGRTIEVTLKEADSTVHIIADARDLTISKTDSGSGGVEIPQPIIFSDGYYN